MSTLQPQVDQRNRIDIAASVLGEAFADYPLFTHTLRDDLRRRAALPLMWRAVARQASRLDQALLDLAERDGQPQGAAIWIPGVGGKVGLGDVLRHGHLRFGVSAGVRDGLRLAGVQDAADRLHRGVIEEPHIYLMALGVRCGNQGRGVGGELLERGLAKADELHQPVYLETYLERNLVLYRRHGFNQARSQPLGGLTCHAMVRPAR